MSEIIPYKTNSFTESVYPCKLNEYLALGLPVVSTNLNELNKKNVFNSNIFSIAKNHKEFVKKIKNELNNDKYEKIIARKKLCIK